MYLGQLSQQMRATIFGNGGTLVSFRTGLQDALPLAVAMTPSRFNAADYQQLPNFSSSPRY